MTSITENLLSQLQGSHLTQMSRQIGLPESQARNAIAAALPLLIGALGRNASQPQGARSLLAALGRDHAGLDIGNVLGSVLGGGGQAAQMLGHIFGQRQQGAAQVAPTPGALANVLGQEQEKIAQQGGIGSRLLSAALDRDHDGDVDFSDLSGMDNSMLGSR